MVSSRRIHGLGERASTHKDGEQKAFYFPNRYGKCCLGAGPALVKWLVLGSWEFSCVVLAARFLFLQKVEEFKSRACPFPCHLVPTLVSGSAMHSWCLYVPCLRSIWPFPHGSQSPSRKARHCLPFHLVIHSTTVCEGTAFIPGFGPFPPTFPSPVRMQKELVDSRSRFNFLCVS